MSIHNRELVYQREQDIVNQKSGILVGTVEDISPVWTTNGDGGLTVCAADGKVYIVSIVGYPGLEEPTKFELHSVRYVQGLPGKKVEIICVEPPTGKYVKARVIREL